MPEGDTIYRVAFTLRQILPGSTVRNARGKTRYVNPQTLVGATFTEVQSRGKHLLLHLQDGNVIHSHMGMTGSWHIYAPGQPWRKPEQWAALALNLDMTKADPRDVITPRDVVCFSPKTLEILSAVKLRRHRYLQQLGPDLMDESLDHAEVIGRFRRHNLATIGEAVLNQTIVCGIGNVYKSETLFLTRTSPFAKIQDLPDPMIAEIVDQARSLMHKNLTGYPRRTRFGNGGDRLWVYGRRGRSCFVCGQAIQMRRQGDLGRSTYWCPTCQPASGVGEA